MNMRGWGLGKTMLQAKSILLVWVYLSILYVGAMPVHAGVICGVHVIKGKCC